MSAAQTQLSEGQRALGLALSFGMSHGHSQELILQTSVRHCGWNRDDSRKNWQSFNSVSLPPSLAKTILGVFYLWEKYDEE